MASNTGVGNPQIEDSDILDILRARDPQHFVMTTNEIAEQLPVGRQAVYERLKRMDRDGIIESFKLSRDVGWHLPNDRLEMAHADGGFGRQVYEKFLSEDRKHDITASFLEKIYYDKLVAEKKLRLLTYGIPTTSILILIGAFIGLFFTTTNIQYYIITLGLLSVISGVVTIGLVWKIYRGDIG